jgi:3-deoxy-D-manno-octulosonic-acid transferase
VEVGAALLMRRLYTLLWWLAIPALPLRLWWRGRREPGYRAHVGERFGRYRGAAPHGEVLWVHAVSLGETRAAAPLVLRLLRERPQATVLLTHMTATGRESGAAWKNPRVVQAWLPYDLPFAVAGFLDHFKPSAGLLMETELWPNLLAAARTRGIPTLLVNARLSERSARGYARVRGFSSALFASLAGAAAQSEADAARLRALGAQDVTVVGNLKFDVAVPADTDAKAQALRERIGTTRPVLLAASTREGEEALLLDALARADGTLPPGTLCVIVPRHPQRFDEVARLLEERGVRYVRRSDARAIDGDTLVLLGDSMGELLAYYAAADVAYVGGSLVPLGGQNLLEALALGTPTLVGPHTFNFTAAVDAALAAGAALRVADADALMAEAARLLRDSPARERMRAAASTFMAAHRGAIDRLWSWLAPRLSGVSRAGAG